MNQPQSELAEMLRSLRPIQTAGAFAICSLPANMPIPPDAIATFRETEGLSVIVPEDTAIDLHLDVLFRAAWITLTVISDLAAVGLTAAVSGALAARGISCNVVAAAFHDHLFVPVDRADEALRILRNLETEA